jgi:hypothetical protein
MRLRTALGGALAILLMTPGLAAADVVATNTFALAPLVGVDGKFHGDNSTATRQASEPNNVAGDDFSVWVRWKAPATGAYTVDLCGNGTAFDTTLGVYRGDDFTTLQFLRSRRANDSFGFCENAASMGASAVTFNATADQEYKISIASRGTVTGTFTGTIQPGPNTGLYTLASFQDNKVGARNPVLALGAGIDGATMACSVDDAPYTGCDDGLELTGLAPGVHTVRARATLGGITDPTPAFTAFTVDTTAPNTLITGVTLGAPGSANALFAATEGSPEIFCSLDGTSESFCGNSESWDGLCPGAHTVTARARDQAFNYDPTAATQAFTTPDGPVCGNAFVNTIAVDPADITTFSARARAEVTTRGRAVSVSFQYGSTPTYGRETAPKLVGGDLDAAPVEEQLYGEPGQVLHYRAVARTGNGAVAEGGDDTVVIKNATVASPTLSTGTPVVTPTTIDIPYTGSLAATLDGVAVVYKRPAGRADMQVIDIRRVPSDGDPHSGTLHVTGLAPDTDTFLLVAVTSVESANAVAKFPLLIHTPPPPVIQPPPPPPPPPPAVTASISKLKTGKAKLSRLRKGKWTASVTCSAKCSVRFTLKKGKTKIAKGTASRASAGKATAKLKLTKKGKKKLRGKSSIKLKLTAQRSDGGPKLSKTVKFK